MCSGDQMKKPLYWLVEQDSRGASELGRGLGWDALREEGKRNQQNPGHAITKAAETAATIYLGGLLGAYGGAGETAGDVAGEGGPAFEAAAANAAAGGASSAASVQQLAALEQSGLLSGIDPETAMGSGGMSVGQQGIGPGSMSAKLAGTYNNPSALMSSNGLLGDVIGGSSKGASGQLATQMGLKMMQPPQQERPRGMPSSGGQMAPMPNPYGSPQGNPYGTPAGNSMGSLGPPPGMSYQEWLRRKQLGLV